MESGRERAAGASTASPRSRARSSTPRTSAPTDLPGWPTTTSHAMLVRAADATHVYTGLDLSRLDGTLKPAVVVTAADLDKAGIRVPEFYAGDLFCPVGKTPLYMGQPVALLICETFDAFDRGAARSCATARMCSSASETGPAHDAELRRLSLHPRRRRRHPTRPTSIRRCRKAGSARAASRTRRCRSGRRSPRRPSRPTARPRPTARRSAPSSPPTIPDCWCSTASSRPSRSIRCSSSRKAASPGTTQKDNRLELVLGVQSPYEAADSVAFLLGKAKLQAGAHQCAVRLCRRRLRRARPYAVPALRRARRDVLSRASRCGSRMTAISSSRPASSGTRSRCARASASTARPARSAPSRPTTCSTAAVSPISRPTSRRSARPRALGIYDVPKVDVTTVALHTRGVTAGSMRGYGTLQTHDGARGAGRRGGGGAAARPDRVPPAQCAQARRPHHDRQPLTRSRCAPPEILDKLETHPIWQQRAEEKARAPAGILVGTGVACVTKDYGTGADCSLGTRGDRRRRPDLDPVRRMSRWATASAPRSPTAWRRISAPWPTR